MELDLISHGVIILFASPPLFSLTNYMATMRQTSSCRAGYVSPVVKLFDSYSMCETVVGVFHIVLVRAAGLNLELCDHITQSLLNHLMSASSMPLATISCAFFPIGFNRLTPSGCFS